MADLTPEGQIASPAHSVVRTVVLKGETITRIVQQMMCGIVCACRRGPDAGTVGKPAKMGVVVSTIPPGLARVREREFFPLSA